MPQIKRIAREGVEEAVFTVAKEPRWVNGLWDCGDASFTDPERDEYAPLPHYEPMTPMAFYLAFTPQERISIKASEDAVVKEFWDTYQLARETNTPINPALSSVTSGLAYLRGAGILASDARVTSILAGIAQ